MNINSGKASTFTDYDELNTTVEPLDKVITAGERGGAMKTHKYVQTDGVENADVIKSDGEYIGMTLITIAYIFINPAKMIINL